jgi:hypothetical protein
VAYRVAIFKKASFFAVKLKKGSSFLAATRIALAVILVS